MGSQFWLWELNENWDVKPVAEMIGQIKDENIFITNNFERPSLNWYAGKQVKSTTSLGEGIFLIKNNEAFSVPSMHFCKELKNKAQWDLIECKIIK